MNIEPVVKEIGETIQREANVRTVFGEPVAMGQHTVVPVAVVQMSLGGGAGGSNAMAKVIPFAGSGGGGALNVTVLPLGFLQEADGRVQFTAIPAGDSETTDLHHALIQRVVERVAHGVK